jgi:oligopeptidase A
MLDDMTPNFSPVGMVDKIKQLIQAGEKTIKQASQGKDWSSVVGPIDKMEFELGKAISVHSHLNSVMFDEDFSVEYEKTLPLIANFYTKIGTHKTLYQAYKKLENTQLDNQQAYILKQTLQEFERSGVALNAQDALRYQEIKEKLSLLNNTFAKNTLKATSEWKKIVKKVELPGYSENELEKIRTLSGDYELNLQMPVYLDAMTYLENTLLREEVYKAYISRASEVGITSEQYDNQMVMTEILSLRLELAQLLGFNNYADYSIASKMVESTEQVEIFLNTLVEKSKHQAKQELQVLSEFAQQVIQPWDVMYYSEKLKNKTFGFKQSDLTPYFPEMQVLTGLFDLIAQLYDVQVKKIKQKSYHSAVQVLSLFRDNYCIGRIYLDLYAREDKRGGAWMADYQTLMGEHKPVAFVVCNLNSPKNDKPALFKFDEIVTIFHEFGHALHHVLTQVKYPSAAGISGVPWDGVELPSQYMEFYAYEKTVIKTLSKHYQTGKSLPDELYEKLLEARYFQSGLQMLRQCEFSLWDIKTHQSELDTYQILAEVRKQTALLPSIAENYFLNTFGHIFSGGYAAGYFSYKWAEVLAADAYYFVKSQGGIKSDCAKNFLYNILEVGSGSDFMSQYIKFRGRKPSIDALLTACKIGEKND